MNFCQLLTSEWLSWRGSTDQGSVDNGKHGLCGLTREAMSIQVKQHSSTRLLDSRTVIIEVCMDDLHQSEGSFDEGRRLIDGVQQLLLIGLGQN